MLKVVRQAKQQDWPLQNDQVEPHNTLQPQHQLATSEQPVMYVAPGALGHIQPVGESSSHLGACRQHRQGLLHTVQAEVRQTKDSQQQAGPLLELYPGVSLAYLNHVLHSICQDRLEVGSLAHNQPPCCTFVACMHVLLVQVLLASVRIPYTLLCVVPTFRFASA